ncbi:MAG: thioredoxin [Propionibacteriaceae bacterium]|jgi:thioredoxin 1|nr:thioredoxin [Propionibacteriaceae bacterium]
MAQVSTVSDDTFATEVLTSDKPVLVDFWATWCAPCKQLSPIVDELAGEYAGKIAFYSLDIDANPATPTQYGIMSVPTLLVFKGGEVVKSIVGARPKGALAKELDSVL